MVKENKEKVERVHFVGVFPQVRVRHLTGPNAGFERTVKEPIAKIWEKRGQVKILGSAKAEPKPEKPDKRKELVKVATELGIKKADKMKEKELIEAIKLAKAEDK